MSNYSNYLRAAGIKTPYDDMTKAQIEDRNKGNPLSGYGFMSAQEKQKRQLEMAMYEREMKRQQDAFQQQLVAQMSSQEKIGHYAGEGVTGLIGALFNRKQKPQEQQTPQDDVELQRFQELAQEVGPEQALAILGAELQNPQMQADAQKQRMDREKAELEMQDLRGKIDDRTNKPNQVITAQRTIDGKPGQVSLEAYGKDPKTGRNLYLEVGQAVKGSVTDTNEGWGNTKGGIDKRAERMEATLASTANALDAYDKMTKLVDENPNALGWSGRLIAKADTIVSGLKNLGQTLAQAEGREANASVDIGDYDWGKFEKVASQSEKMKSLVLQLAYAQAAATGDSSRSLSDRDVQNQIDIIGGQITNPNTFKALMQQNREILVQKLENLGKYTKVNGKSIGEGYESDIQGLVDRVRSKPTSEDSSVEDKKKRLEYLRNKRKAQQ
jgi:hypothetical protein